MKIRNHKKLAALTFALTFLSVGITNAQTQNAYGWSTGYGTVLTGGGAGQVTGDKVYTGTGTEKYTLTPIAPCK